jgi:endogenous inhibitor of DNA gyrase (YacG/DUF329 family)
MRCPICKTQITPDMRPHRPFCSARCKTIDLAKWLTEDYRIPVTSDADEDGTSDDGEVAPTASGSGSGPHET